MMLYRRLLGQFSAVHTEELVVHVVKQS